MYSSKCPSYKEKKIAYKICKYNTVYEDRSNGGSILQEGSVLLNLKRLKYGWAFKQKVNNRYIEKSYN